MHLPPYNTSVQEDQELYRRLSRTLIIPDRRPISELAPDSSYCRSQYQSTGEYPGAGPSKVLFCSISMSSSGEGAVVDSLRTVYQAIDYHP